MSHPESAAPDWSKIAASPDFNALLARKRRFLIPCTIFFLVYYVLLLVLVGYCKEFMDTQILGKLNIAYVFAFSQFFMVWIMAWIYVREASVWDKESARIIAQFQD
jgi:uncharacterized membrane protein (DUF485 family)